MIIQATTAGLTAKLSPVQPDSWLWKGELYNASGPERTVSFTYNPTREKAVLEVAGMEESTFTKQLCALLWNQARAVDPDGRRHYSVTQAEMFRPALGHFGKQYAHWRPYSIVPQPEPEKLYALVQDLEDLGLKAKAGIEVGMGAVLGVAVSTDKEIEEIDGLVEVAVAAMQRA